LLSRLNKESVLDQLVTGEKWILYNIQRKRIWKLADERAESMAKDNLHPEKMMFPV